MSLGCCLNFISEYFCISVCALFVILQGIAGCCHLERKDGCPYWPWITEFGFAVKNISHKIYTAS